MREKHIMYFIRSKPVLCVVFLLSYVHSSVCYDIRISKTTNKANALNLVSFFKDVVKF